MKTIEEKAKAYDEALERAQKLLTTKVAADIFPELKDVENKTLNNDDYAFLRDCARVLKTYGWQSYADRLISLCPTVGEEVKDMISTPIIPKESEDERIRKEIIVFLKSDARTQVIPTKQYELWLTWLEKQGEQKPVDKVKPKFKVGDWFVYNDNLYHVCNIALQHYYECLRVDGTVNTFGLDIDSKSHLWTIQDAKDGDVLSYREGQWIFIFKKKRDENEFAYHALLSDKGLCVNDAAFSLLGEAIFPATKEQRDTLIKEMTDAGYTFDFEKKELKKIVDEEQIRKNLQDNSFRRMFEQKPAWSEEDEKMLSETIKSLDACKVGYPLGNIDNEINWLKSLRDRVQPKQEWSEDDERILSSIINDITTDKSICKYQITKDICDSQINWLKSLRPQNKWKPSEEQMEALKETCDEHWEPDGLDSLYTLYQDLKKLREE